jgi:hypothetical protein
MPPQISESYAAPYLRWGLLLEDHPGARYQFELVVGTEMDPNPIPSEFGGDRKFCVATIHFPASSGLASVSAYKPANDGSADEWNTLCSKALGRALKKAGYPDDMKDLKALLLWRQRNAEMEAVMSGSSPAAITSGGEGSTMGALPAGPSNVEDALDDAGVSDPEQVSGDDVPVDAEIVGEEVDELREMVTELVEGLNDKEFENFDGFLETIEAPSSPADMTHSQLSDALAWLDPDKAA